MWEIEDVPEFEVLTIHKSLSHENEESCSPANPLGWSLMAQPVARHFVTQLSRMACRQLS